MSVAPGEKPLGRFVQFPCIAPQYSLLSRPIPRDIPAAFRECVIGVRPILDDALPEISVATAFAPLSRGQANIKALAFGRRHGPAAAGAGAFIFVSSITFATLGLAEPLLRALDRERFLQPTPIQASAIPPLLAGRDLLGIAQTGTGKTAAFALPMLQHLAARPEPAAPLRHACPDPGADPRTGAADRGRLHRLGGDLKRASSPFSAASAAPCRCSGCAAAPTSWSARPVASAT